MDHLRAGRRKINPREKANIVSILSFFYTLELFKKGYKNDIEENDLYEVVKCLESKKLGNRLEEEWEQQKCTRKKLSVTRLFWKCYGWEYLAIGCIQLLVKSTIIVLQPKALGKLVAYFDPNRNDITEFDAYFYAFLLIGLNLAHCVYVHNYHFLLMSLGLRVRTAFCSFLYRKALKLDPAKLGDISIGKIVTLITKDVAAFEVFIQFANDVWVGIAKTIVVCYFIYNKIGIAALAGIGFYFIAFPIQILLGRWCAKLRTKMCKRTDERLQITQETLSAIRIIKMYTWERFFEKKILNARQKEISSMHMIFYLKFFVISFIGTMNSEFAFYLVIVTYIWLGNTINAEIVYYIQNCFGILTFTLTVLLPVGITNTAELFASLKRIGAVMKADEIRKKTQNEHITIKPKILLTNLCVTFKNTQILNDINIDLNGGLTLIIGPVGSGKSFLLKTIIQEYQPNKGNLLTHGRISYASQEPWLFPSSIRQNIVFGEYFDEKRYQHVLNICALRYDFDLLENGDQTIVEDRGINLSKGQQARINLARCIYKDADIYLLDDCLSALDTQVCDFIFRECIKKFLNNKLVLFVTHNRNYLYDVDNVIVMEKGCIVETTKPTQLDEKIISNSIDNIDNSINNNEGNCDENEFNEETKLLKQTTKKTYQENKQSGSVPWNVYYKYTQFGGGISILIIIIGLFGAAQFVLSYTQKLISEWVNVETILTNQTLQNTTDYENLVDKRSSMMNMYTLMVLISACLCVIRSIAIFVFSRKVSINLHRLMIGDIINAKMYFFDTSFIGNILNRFSKDLTAIDESLPLAFFHFFRVFFVLIGIIILTATVDAIFLIPTGIIFITLVVIREAYIRTGRSLKRLDAITRSPVVGHLNATLEGLTPIRAFKKQQILKDEFDRHQDLYTSATYVMQTCIRAFGFLLDTICSCFLGVIIARFLIFKDNTLAGSVGLALSQAFMMVGTLQWGVRQWAEIENQMTSVERALEYTEIQQENKQGSNLENWPQSGVIQYNDVSLIYPNSTEKVLKNINFTVGSREKIGIIGRTGAGKSSIISTLFRLYDIDGVIRIDEVDIRTLSLDYLRSKISIIPQDPVVFSGTIRDNIDPIGRYTDKEIWHGIEIANLKHLIPNLDYEIAENGFSIGQRQLICLARAIVRDNKIIVLDEATASMDKETDHLFNETIKKNLSDCTILIIAHKLHSILNCDKILVLDKGEIVEFDEPKNLLNNKSSNFYKIVQKAKLVD